VKGANATALTSSPENAAGIVAGKPIDTGEATAKLPMLRGTDVLQPVGAFGKLIVVSVSPQQDRSGATQRFETWDPATGAFVKAWTGEAGKQDIIGGIAGDWAATVRTSLDLPFGDWVVILRNLRTGESRTLAQSDSAVASDPTLKPDLPLGFAPLPSISGAVVVWDEYRRAGSSTEKRVQAYDIATGTAQTIASVADAGATDLRLAVVLGDTVAWVRRDFATKSADIEVHNLSTGSDRMLGVGGSPWQVALLDGGKSVAWDDNLQAKYVRPIDGGVATKFAGEEGWGVQSNGAQVTWTPAGAQDGTGGFFDPATKTVRLLPKKQAVRTNIATVLGPWFVWQELLPATSGGSSGGGEYYFVPLPAG
jgi:hypothetical protein